LNKEQIHKEVEVSAVRSSGAGGQHVNKVSSKIVLRFNLKNTNAFTIEEKQLLEQNLVTSLSKNKVLIITSQESRSQHKNKEIAFKKLFTLLKKSLFVKKKRKATKPSKSAVKKRLEKKARHALKKVNRKKIKY
jgi:ribosome-associated protein